MPAQRAAPRAQGICAFGATLLLAFPARTEPDVTTPATTTPATTTPAVAEAPPTPAETAVTAFAAGTHFSMSWVRLPGAENCVPARELSRAVEARLHRPALGAPAETDVAIEGYAAPVEDGSFHAVVTIADARGTVVGKRELDAKGPDCRAMDAPLALAIALMIDPDAAFAATAAPPLRPPRVPPPPRPKKAPSPPVKVLHATMAAGVTLGFGVLPGMAKGAWVSAAIDLPGLFPIELDAHSWLNEAAEPEPGVRVAFSRTTFALLGCPLGAALGTFHFGACAGVDAGALTAFGSSARGLLDRRKWIVDANLRGSADWFFSRNVGVRLTAALVVPFIRDSFDYLDSDGDSPEAFSVGPVGGDVGLGVAVKVP